MLSRKKIRNFATVREYQIRLAFYARVNYKQVISGEISREILSGFSEK